MKAEASLSIGVTGHLLLTATERDHVASVAKARFLALLSEEPSLREIRLVSGLAPGADLVLTETLLNCCKEKGLHCHLTAAIVDAPDELLRRWQQRSIELGAEITPLIADRVAAQLHATLRRADRQLRFITPENAPLQGFQQLAALIAESCEVLFAVTRPGHAGRAGGAAETVSWWEKRNLVPPNLRLGLGGERQQGQRRLIQIDPGISHGATVKHLLAELDEIHAHLRGGNSLSANDLANRALRRYPLHSKLRYYFLLSLAQSGSSRRALQLYKQMAPSVESGNLDEDWMALLGRIHKDLAISSRSSDRCQTAAKHYEEAYIASGGIYSAVNAATMHALAGNGKQSQSLASDVIQRTDGPLPHDETARYYQLASRAEAFILLGDEIACAEALRAANPLLRNDLRARARTRTQLRLLLEHLGRTAQVLEELEMPYIYLLGDTAGPAEPAPQSLILKWEGSPVYAQRRKDSEARTSAIEQLQRANMRMHLLSSARNTDAISQAEVDAPLIERHVRLRGFLESEHEWFEQRAQRHLLGLARLNAQQLDVEVRELKVEPNDMGFRWEVSSHISSVDSGDTNKPPDRSMVGLVFTDLVGFSAYDDATVARYWTDVVPHLAQALKPLRARIQLQQTWGDAIHLVTEDAVTAAQATQALLATIKQLRKHMKGSSPRPEMRVGAHFAPAWKGMDSIENSTTWFGSQLSLTARVEPVTPPGTTYVTEPFAAEIAVTAPNDFQLEYAGEVQLAKNHGEFRLYSLRSRPPNQRRHF